MRGQESGVPGAKQAAGDAGLNRCRTNPQESLRKDELWGSTVNRGQDVSCGRDDGKESSGETKGAVKTVSDPNHRCQEESGVHSANARGDGAFGESS